MTLKKTLAIALPSLLAGGLLFGTAFGRAEAPRGDLVGFWPVAEGIGVKVAERAKKAPRPPQPPPPPHGPVPPVPPMAPHAPGGGISVSIHDGKIDIAGVDAMARAQIAAARAQIANNPHMPPQVRDKVLARLDRAAAKLDRQLANVKGKDLDQLGRDLEKMGEELEAEMEGLADELEDLKFDFDAKDLGKDLAKKFSKDWATKNFKNFKFQWDSDDDDDDDDDADDADDDDDVDDDDADDADISGVVPSPGPGIAPHALADLDHLGLAPAQRDAIAQLGRDSEKAVAAAQVRMDQLSEQLHDELAKPAANQAQIGALIDQVTAQEAAIRKARILGWVKARQILDAKQRAKLEK